MQSEGVETNETAKESETTSLVHGLELSSGSISHSARYETEDRPRRDTCESLWLGHAPLIQAPYSVTTCVGHFMQGHLLSIAHGWH